MIAPAFTISGNFFFFFAIILTVIIIVLLLSSDVFTVLCNFLESVFGPVPAKICV